ncbi:MAG: hypothetical protein ACLPY5_10930 [Candidatus Bathyarchaeia archaeon]
MLGKLEGKVAARSRQPWNGNDMGTYVDDPAALAPKYRTEFLQHA